MACSTHITRTVIDHEPDAEPSITVRHEEDDSGFIVVLIEQGLHSIGMRLDHAQAVSDALAALIDTLQS